MSSENQLILVASKLLDDTGSTTVGFGYCFEEPSAATDNATFFGANF